MLGIALRIGLGFPTAGLGFTGGEPKFRPIYGADPAEATVAPHERESFPAERFALT
jgi:hypothetical protein